MDNTVQNGGTVTLTAPYTVTAGSGALVVGIFGVAVNDTTISTEGEFVTHGVFDLVALGTDTIDQGQVVYWDNTNKRVTETAADNYRIGVALAAKGSGPTTCRVRLDGISIIVEPGV